MTAIVELHQVSKRFSSSLLRTSLVKRLAGEGCKAMERCILESVSLTVSMGECIGIIGRNGAGKSTLLRIIAGILTPSSGTIKTSGRVLPLLSSDIGFTEELEIRDNMMLYGALIGVPASKIRANLDRILSFAGLAGRAADPIRVLSPGMRARLAFAVAAQSTAQLILIDELVAFGDEAFRASVKEQVKLWLSEKRAVLHVSHDSATIGSLSTRVLQLENGRICEPRKKTAALILANLPSQRSAG